MGHTRRTKALQFLHGRPYHGIVRSLSTHAISLVGGTLLVSAQSMHRRLNVLPYESGLPLSALGSLAMQPSKEPGSQPQSLQTARQIPNIAVIEGGRERHLDDRSEGQFKSAKRESPKPFR